MQGRCLAERVHDVSNVFTARHTHKKKPDKTEQQTGTFQAKLAAVVILGHQTESDQRSASLWSQCVGDDETGEINDPWKAFYVRTSPL